MRENDTIISFNYDRAVELLSPEIPLENGASSRWGVHIPGVEYNSAEEENDGVATMAKLPTLLKLHGSVDWIGSIGEDAMERAIKWDAALLSQAKPPLIATPGQSKMLLASGKFKRLWGKARKALEEANEVHFLGYRFPPSDSYARDQLLRALAGNEKQPLKVHTVLGPAVRGDDSRRLVELLLEVLACETVFWGSDFTRPGGQKNRHKQVKAHSLYVEDYLSVWSMQTPVPPTR